MASFSSAKLATITSKCSRMRPSIAVLHSSMRPYSVMILQTLLNTSGLWSDKQIIPLIFRIFEQEVFSVIHSLQYLGNPYDIIK